MIRFFINYSENISIKLNEGVTYMVHYLKLESSIFELISGEKKLIVFGLLDEKGQKIQVKDKIVFLNELVSCRSIQVDVDSILVAKSFEQLYKMVNDSEGGEVNNPPELCRFYTKDEEKQYGVVGIRFSLDNSRNLQEIYITNNDVIDFIRGCDRQKIKKEMVELILREFACNEETSLYEIVIKLDDLVTSFIYGETVEFNNKILEQGYDNFYEFADREFDLEEYYPEVSWWKKTRKELVTYFAGGKQNGFDECYFYSAVD